MAVSLVSLHDNGYVEADAEMLDSAVNHHKFAIWAHFNKC